MCKSSSNCKPFISFSRCYHWFQSIFIVVMLVLSTSLFSPVFAEYDYSWVVDYYCPVVIIGRDADVGKIINNTHFEEKTMVNESDIGWAVDIYNKVEDVGDIMDPEI